PAGLAALADHLGSTRIPMHRRVAFALAAALLPTLAPAAEGDTISVSIENDFFAGMDQHYTSGLQLAWLGRISELPAGLAALPPFDRSADALAVFAVGQRT